MTVDERDSKSIKVLYLVGEANLEGSVTIASISHVAESNDLNRAEQRHEPSVVVPRTLIFWVCKVGMLQTFQILFDSCERQMVRFSIS